MKCNKENSIICKHKTSLHETSFFSKIVFDVVNLNPPPQISSININRIFLLTNTIFGVPGLALYKMLNITITYIYMQIYIILNIPFVSNTMEVLYMYLTHISNYTSMQKQIQQFLKGGGVSGLCP